MLVAIEGIDGSGKGTQSRELVTRLTKLGHTADLLSFPRYNATNASQMIAAYLTGKFGDISETLPEFAAILFAMDRMESRDHLQTILRQNEVVVVDRYVASNLAYQCARILAEKRDLFLNWLLQLEYMIYSLPKPDVTLFLDVPAVTSQKLVSQKETRTYTKEVYDIHERNTEYLTNVRDTYHWLIDTNVIDPCYVIRCVNQEDILREMSDIGQEICDVVIQRLSAS